MHPAKYGGNVFGAALFWAIRETFLALKRSRHVVR